MKVFIAQIKPYLGDVEKNLENMIKIIEEQINKKTDIVVFPELALTGYLLDELVFEVAIEKVPDKLLELSQKISIIFGAVELSENGLYYNAAYYLEDGQIKYRHRKVYLPKYALFDECKYFNAGDKIRAFDTKFGRVGILINEDALEQSSSELLLKDRAKTIFILTNLSVCLTQNGLQNKNSWETICKSIVLSNNCNLVLVNRVGVEDGITFYGESFALTSEVVVLEKMDILKEDGKIVNFD